MHNYDIYIYEAADSKKCKKFTVNSFSNCSLIKFAPLWVMCLGLTLGTAVVGQS